MKYCIEAKVDVNAKDNEGKTPEQTVKNGCEAEKFLESIGAKNASVEKCEKEKRLFWKNVIAKSLKQGKKGK